MWINRKYFQGYSKGRNNLAKKILKFLSSYDDNDLVKVKYIRQLLSREVENVDQT